MWYLQSVTDAALRFALVAGKDLIVGRKDCDILISGEQSISRKHATVYVNEGSPGVVTLTDCKSKFGTSVNGKKMGASQKVELHRDDIVTFGQGPAVARQSRFRLIFEPLVFCCSAMSKAESAKVKQLARSLGAVVESNWSERCSHLIMTGITVTVKVVSALSSCKPVVTPAWVEECTRCYHASLPLPSPSSFQPDVVDANINSGAGGAAVSFAPNYKRTGLFQDRVFYFLSEKQCGRLKACLLSAGAASQLISSPDGLPLETLTKEQSVVVAVDGDLMKQATPTEKKWILKVYTFLRRRELRAISDSEIGFALLYISAEEFCNPRATPSLPMSSSPLAPPTLSQAPATQPHSSQQHSLTHPNTLPYSQGMITPSFTHDQTTILAPDTLDPSQLPTGSNVEKGSISGSVQKIDETITTTVKGSFDKCAPSLENKSISVKTENPHEDNQRSKVQVPSVSEDKSPLRNSKSSQSTVKCPPPESSSTASTSTCKTATNPSGVPSSTRGQSSTGGQSAVPSVKSEPLDSLFGDGMDACGPPGPLEDCGRHREVSGEWERGREASENKQEEKLVLGGNEGDTERSSQESSSSQRSKLKLKSSCQSQRRGENTTTATTGRGAARARVVYSELSHGVNQDIANVPCHSKIEKAPAMSSHKASGAGSKIGVVSTLSGDQKQRQEQNGEMGSLPKTLPNNPSLCSDTDVPPPSQLEGSIIVPSSLTPRTQDKAKLPDSQELAFAFQGKRKKRSHNDASEDDQQNDSKKKRVQEEEGGEGEGGEGKVSGVEVMKGTVGRVGEEVREGERRNGKEDKDKDIHARATTNSFSGLKDKTNTRRENVSTSSSDKTLPNLPGIMKGLPLLETREDTAQESGSLQTADNGRKNGKKKFALEEELMDVEISQEANMERASGADSAGPPTQNFTKTPQCVAPPTPNPSLFLSTRKKPKKSPHDLSTATPSDPTTPGKATSSTTWCPFTQYTSTTQQTAVATQRTGVCIATPFTALVTGGKRSKVSDHDTTAALWDDEGKDQLDGEDPLVDGSNEADPKKVYKPVCDEDGFVCSRIKPRVQASRMGRLAAFVDSQHSNYSSEGGGEGGGGGGGGGDGSQDGAGRTEPLARTVYARLVVAGRRKGKRVRRGEGTDGAAQAERRSNSGAKNFKKFRKVMHIGMGAIPRLLSLKEYVPPTSRELQDWMEEQENVVEQEQERESSQDLFRFTSTTTAGRRWRQ